MIIILFVGLLIFLLLCKQKEYFTISKRDGKLCKPLLNDNTENYLMQHPYVSMVVQGYNYSETPIFYRDGKKITPMDYEYNNTTMAYYFILYAPNGICNHEWILETSDFVKPIVSNGVTNTDFNVTLERKRGGFNKWKIEC